jgi:hypothetical protein
VAISRDDALGVTVCVNGRRLKSLEDMLTVTSTVAHERARAEIEDELSRAVPKSGPIASPRGPWTWLRYQEAEGFALERITRSTLDLPRSSWRDGRRLNSAQARAQVTDVESESAPTQT